MALGAKIQISMVITCASIWVPAFFTLAALGSPEDDILSHLISVTFIPHPDYLSCSFWGVFSTYCLLLNGDQPIRSPA